MNYTSLEQSKHLLELGLKSETADMCWKQVYDEDHLMSDHQVNLIPYKLYSGSGIPCWSVGALLELMPMIEKYSPLVRKEFDGIGFIGGYIDMTGDYLYGTHSYDTPIEAAYNIVVWLLQNNYIKTVC